MHESTSFLGKCKYVFIKILLPSALALSSGGRTFLLGVYLDVDVFGLFSLLITLASFAQICMPRFLDLFDHLTANSETNRKRQSYPLCAVYLHSIFSLMFLFCALLLICATAIYTHISWSDLSISLLTAFLGVLRLFAYFYNRKVGRIHNFLYAEGIVGILSITILLGLLHYVDWRICYAASLLPTVVFMSYQYYLLSKYVDDKRSPDHSYDNVYVFLRSNAQFIVSSYGANIGKALSEPCLGLLLAKFGSDRELGFFVLASSMTAGARAIQNTCQSYIYNGVLDAHTAREQIQWAGVKTALTPFSLNLAYSIISSLVIYKIVIPVFGVNDHVLLTFMALSLSYLINSFALWVYPLALKNKKLWLFTFSSVIRLCCGVIGLFAAPNAISLALGLSCGALLCRLTTDRYLLNQEKSYLKVRSAM